MGESIIPSGYKKSPLGVIPIDWEVSTVGKAFMICNNLRFPISEEIRTTIKGIYPYYGPTKIQDYINEFRVEGRYALIGEDGDHFLKWRELPMTLLVEGKFNVNNHAHIVKGQENLTEWFYYYFNHKELTPYLTRQGAGRYKLTKDALGKIPCLLPPVEVQHKIVDLLTCFDKAINTIVDLINNKQLLKKWVLQHLLTGKKRLPGFAEQWREIKLGDIIEEFTQKTTSEKEFEVFTSSKKGLVRQKDYFGDNRITERDNTGFNIIPPGYITYRSRSDDGIFTFNQNQFDYTGLISIYYPVFKIRNADAKFFLEYANYFSSEFKKHSVGTSQLVLSINDFKKIKFILPSYKEQVEIAKILLTIDKENQLLKRKLALVKEQKRGMMQFLLTGRRKL